MVEVGGGVVRGEGEVHRHSGGEGSPRSRLHCTCGEVQWYLGAHVQLVSCLPGGVTWRSVVASLVEMTERADTGSSFPTSSTWGGWA